MYSLLRDNDNKKGKINPQHAGNFIHVHVNIFAQSNSMMTAFSLIVLNGYFSMYNVHFILIKQVAKILQCMCD